MKKNTNITIYVIMQLNHLTQTAKYFKNIVTISLSKVELQ